MKKRGGIKIKDFILDIFFPIKCVSCQKVYDTYLCKQCFFDINFRKVQECPFCHKESRYGYVCNYCDSSLVKGVYVLCDYTDVLEKVIHAFKYKNIMGLKKLLKKIILQGIDENIINNFKDFVLIPVPLHKKREVERGFNQSFILAKIIAQIFDIEVKDDVIFRQKYTKKQSHLGKSERRRNVSNVFEISKKSCKFNKKVILVDDLYTTGSTMLECAKTFQNYGCLEIYGFVVARSKL